MPANTGKAGAIPRAACFAGMPAPTEIAQAFKFSVRQLLPLVGTVPFSQPITNRYHPIRINHYSAPR